MLKWILVLLLVLIIFGAGKLPKVMGDIGKGFKNFKKEIGDDKTEEVKTETRDGPVIDVKPERKED